MSAPNKYIAHVFVQQTFFLNLISSFNYELLIARGFILSDDVDFAFRATTKNTSMTIDRDDFAQPTDANTTFKCGVRIVTAQGYTSDIEDYEVIRIDLPSNVTMSDDSDEDDDDDDDDELATEEASLMKKFETEMIVIGVVMLFLALTFFVTFGFWYCGATRHPPIDETPMRQIRSRSNIYRPTVEENMFTLGDIEENDEERLIDEDS